ATCTADGQVCRSTGATTAAISPSPPTSATCSARSSCAIWVCAMRRRSFLVTTCRPRDSPDCSRNHEDREDHDDREERSFVSFVAFVIFVVRGTVTDR